MQTVIKKQKLNRIHSKLDWNLKRNERVFQQAIQQWFALTIKQIQTDLRTKFQKDITTELTDWKFLEEQGIKTIKPASLKVIESGGNQAYKLMQIEGAFDVLNVASVKAAEKFCAKLVTEVNNSTKKGIRTYISTGIKEGKSMDKIARELRSIVGLTESQTESVMNYRNLLQEQGLNVDVVDKKVQRYADKTHRYRTEMIARTETANAQSIGYLQGMDDIGVEKVEFSAYPGCCDICQGLDKDKYKVEDAEGVIPVHPNCRCAWLPVIK